MRQVIEKLWNGNMEPYENCGTNDPEIQDLSMLITRNKDKLYEILDTNQRNIFEKYVDCEEEYTHLICKCAFSDGFCLAGKLFAEALLGGLKE